jgi:hypothetical protein
MDTSPSRAALDSSVPALIRIRKLADDGGISPGTIRNYAAKGLLEIVHIAGSAYVTGESLRLLIERARKGEVAKRNFAEFFSGTKAKQKT